MEKLDCYKWRNDIKAGESYIKHRDKLFFIGQFDLSLLYWKNLSKETTFMRENLRRITNESKEQWLFSQAKQNFRCLNKTGYSASSPIFSKR